MAMELQLLDLVIRRRRIADWGEKKNPTNCISARRTTNADPDSVLKLSESGGFCYSQMPFGAMGHPV